MTPASEPNPIAVAFMREHAGYSYDSKHETAEEGRDRNARELARAEDELKGDPTLFIVWDYDDIDSSSFEKTDNPRPLYVAMLCRDCEPAQAQVTRGYDPSDGIFERPGIVVASLGGIDLSGANDPYRRVIEAEIYLEFDSGREANITRGDS